MGKEWEDRQLEKLKALQEKRLSSLQEQVEKETVKKNDPSQL